MLAAILAMGLISACDTSNDSDVELSSECLVTGAVMGSLNRTMHTLSSQGEDSTYTVTVTGSYYPLYIDQQGGRIYNGDSLPCGTDVSKVTFSSFTAVGTPAIRSLASGTDTTLTLTDSTDFSRERVITVYATDGASKREYRMSVNVHQEEGDSFRWQQASTADTYLAALSDLRLVAVGDRLYAFGDDGGSRVLLATSAAQSGQWSRVSLGGGAPEPSSVQRVGETFYGLSDDGVVSSADGIAWSPVGSTLRPEALVAAGSRHLFAWAGGKLYASADGAAWTEETLDEPEHFPTGSFAASCVASTTDETFESVVLTGRRDGAAVVWKRYIDLTGGSDYPWNYYPDMFDNPYGCPVLASPSMAAYDGATLLCGLSEESGAPQLFLSRDNGRTWKTDEIALPGMAAPSALAVAVTGDNYIWIVCTGTGETWRGRHNRLGWESQQFTFTRSSNGGAAEAARR